MQRKYTGSLLVLMLAWGLALGAKPAPQQQMVPYKLEHTDNILMEKVDNEYITHFVGNVHLFYGNIEFRTDQADVFDKQDYVAMAGHVSARNDTLRIFSDTAIYYRMQSELHADGHVRAIKDTLVFTGDKAVFYHKQNHLIVTGNALYTENHADSTYRTVEGDKVDYYRSEGKVVAEGHVLAHDSREKMRGHCGYLEYDLNSGYGYLLREPAVWLEGKDSLYIESQKMEYYRNDRKLVANFNVRTWNKDYRSESNFLIFFMKTEEAVFLGNPVFHLDQADAWATEFHIFFRDNKIYNAQLRDSCKVIFAAETGELKQDRVNAEQMAFDFTDGNLRHCTASGNVDAHVRQEHKGKREFLMNNSKGREMELFVGEDHKIEKLLMRGKVTGTHHFENNDKK